AAGRSWRRSRRSCRQPLLRLRPELSLRPRRRRSTSRRRKLHPTRPGEAAVRAERPFKVMELLIVRHAIAFERDRRRWPEDSERPLSPAGIRRARRAAAGLKELIAAPERVLTSPL